MTSRSVRTLLTMLAVVAATFFTPINPVTAEAADNQGESKTVLITGANRGLGLEFARQYTEAGWRVIGTARKPEKAVELKDLKVRILQLDVTDSGSVAALASTLEGMAIDLLINNAGMMDRDANSIEELDFDTVARVLAVNTIGPTPLRNL